MRNLGPIAAKRKRTVAAPAGTTQLLLHADGTNGSTTFTDSSANAFAMTAGSDATISTSQSVFGGASGRLNGSNGHVYNTVAQNLLRLNTQAWSMEGRFRFDSISATSCFIGNMDGNQFYFELSGGTLTFYYNIAGGGSATISYSWTGRAADTWYSLAVTCEGAGVTNGLRMFIDGVVVATGTLDAAGIFDSFGSAVINIGKRALFSGAGMTGYFDEFRFRTGAALYTANYTPSGSAFTS